VGIYGANGQYTQYSVAETDDLSSIAAIFNTTSKLLQRLNPFIAQPGLLAPGQKLWVPRGNAGSPAYLPP